MSKQNMHEQAPPGCKTNSMAATYCQVKTRRVTRSMTAADGVRSPGAGEEVGDNLLTDHADVISQVMDYVRDDGV